MARFEGKVAIVTGAAGGLGGATAARLASEGATVVMTDIADNAGRRLAEAIGARFIRHDVSDGSAWAQVAQTALDDEGRIDVLVDAAVIEGDVVQG